MIRGRQSSRMECSKYFFFLNRYSLPVTPKMPVGIQMFATITSKHHYATLQRDLRRLATEAVYQDATVQCGDGRRRCSRLILGLLFPELHTVTSFSLLPEVTYTLNLAASSCVLHQYFRCLS